MRRGYGKFDYGFRDRVDYEALRRERIPEKTHQFVPLTLFFNTTVFLDAALVGSAQTITGTAYAGEADTFGTTVVTRGAVPVNPALFTNAQTFNVATLAVGAVAITGTLFSDLPDSFGAAVVSRPPAQSLTPALFADADTFNAATLVPGAVAITGTLFSDLPDSFGAAVIARAALQVAPALFTDPDTFGLGFIALGGDSVPNAFTFIDQTNVALNTVVTSAPIAVTGIDTPTTIMVAGGTYSINGAAYTSTSGFVVNGDTVTVRHTSSGSNGTSTGTVVTIGGVSDIFSSITVVLTQSLTPTLFTDADSFNSATVARPGAGGIVGSPVGLLLVWTNPQPATAGQPVGLLLSLTKAA